MNLPMKILSEKGIEIVEEGFVDSGAGGKFINQNYVQTKGFRKERLSEPIKVYNVDGTPNKQGIIGYYVNLNIEIHGRKWKEQLLVTGLGKHRIILGLPWLRKTNPIIDWEKRTLEWRNPKPINPFKMARKLAKQAIKYSSDKQHQEIQTGQPQQSLKKKMRRTTLI